MFTIASIKELIQILQWSKDLLIQMFEKRKDILYKYEYALEILDAERIDSLIEKGIIRVNGIYLELDDSFLDFFEQVLDVNEEINTAYIHENIEQIKETILYYLQENNESRKYGYLRTIKSSIRKTGRIILRNIFDLNRNIDNAFKTEPNYKIKITKLQHYDRKRENIITLIEQIAKLINEEELTFFRVALDEELKTITILLRHQLNESRHNLVELQTQIIEYLNRIKYQTEIIEKIRQVKYLKDQFELKTKTNFLEVLSKNISLLFEPKPSYSLKLSLEQLKQDSIYDLLLKVNQKNKSGIKPTMPVAGAMSNEYLNVETEEEIIINLDELKQNFIASGTDLFQFILYCSYPREVSFEEKVTIYCQMVSFYEKEFNVTETFNSHKEIEYAMVFPK
ncbi:hypothetical protein [Flavobacterium sp.]|uniref:hypothetical protein n=1 Tax=Flavobacterium sp. TaxID=239 RepID=UPI0025BF7D26|nr:hypothetical protein [Flavobacterium sp.]